MVQLGLFLWALFFAVMAFSMMPGYMTFVVIVSAVCGVMDAANKDKKRKRRKPNFKLHEWEKNF